MNTNKTYTVTEEKFNTYSHLSGFILTIIGGIFLITKTFQSENIWAIVSDSIFIFSMGTMFFTSAFYHNTKDTDRKQKLRKADHAAIFLQIAGSYTPFTLIILREKEYWGWSLFGIVWTAALIGVYFSFRNKKKGTKIETISYVGMGWVVISAIKPLIETLSAIQAMEVFQWLIIGGICYTLGAVLYQFKKIKYMHFVFHLFVIAGSASHFFAICLIPLK